jgi:class 3 adenylate cyclase
MQQRLPELNQESERRRGSVLALRIGVNTGEFVADDASTRETFRLQRQPARDRTCPATSRST